MSFWRLPSVTRPEKSVVKLSADEILEEIAFYKNLERQIAASGKSYSMDSGGGSRQWTNHDLREIRKILAGLRGKYENAVNGLGLGVGAGW
jgi:hypothetical protein